MTVQALPRKAPRPYLRPPYFSQWMALAALPILRRARSRFAPEGTPAPAYMPERPV